MSTSSHYHYQVTGFGFLQGSNMQAVKLLVLLLSLKLNMASESIKKLLIYHGRPTGCELLLSVQVAGLVPPSGPCDVEHGHRHPSSLQNRDKKETWTRNGLHLSRQRWFRISRQVFWTMRYDNDEEEKCQKLSCRQYEKLIKNVAVVMK